jgi:hypothetical protein
MALRLKLLMIMDKIPITFTENIIKAIQDNSFEAFNTLISQYNATDIEERFALDCKQNLIHYLVLSDWSFDRNRMLDAWLAREGVDIDVRDANYNTGLAVSVKAQTAYATKLLDHNANPHTRYYDDHPKGLALTFLGIGLSNWHHSQKELSDILQGTEERISQGTPLLVLICNKTSRYAEDIFNGLLKKKVSVIESDAFMQNPLHLLCDCTQTSEIEDRIARIVAISSEGINRPDIWNRLPLNILIKKKFPEKGCEGVFKVLFERGANPWLVVAQEKCPIDKAYQWYNQSESWEIFVNWCGLEGEEAFLLTKIFPKMHKLTDARDEFQEIWDHHVGHKMSHAGQTWPVGNIAALLGRAKTYPIDGFKVNHPYLMDYLLAMQDPSFLKILEQAMTVLPEEFSHPISELPLHFQTCYRDLFCVVMSETPLMDIYRHKTEKIADAVHENTDQDTYVMFDRFRSYRAWNLVKTMTPEETMDAFDEIALANAANEKFQKFIGVYKALQGNPLNPKDRLNDGGSIDLPISFATLFELFEDDLFQNDFRDVVIDALNFENKEIIRDLQQNPKAINCFPSLRFPAIGEKTDQSLETARSDLLLALSQNGLEPFKAR